MSRHPIPPTNELGLAGSWLESPKPEQNRIGQESSLGQRFFRGQRLAAIWLFGFLGPQQLNPIKAAASAAGVCAGRFKLATTCNPHCVISLLVLRSASDVHDRTGKPLNKKNINILIHKLLWRRTEAGLTSKPLVSQVCPKAKRLLNELGGENLLHGLAHCTQPFGTVPICSFVNTVVDVPNYSLVDCVLAVFNSKYVL